MMFTEITDSSRDKSHLPGVMDPAASGAGREARVPAFVSINEAIGHRERASMR